MSSSAKRWTARSPAGIKLAERLYGYTAEEMIGQSIVAHLPARRGLTSFGTIMGPPAPRGAHQRIMMRFASPKTAGGSISP